MNRLETIKKKIEQVEELLTEIKGELEALSKENKPRQTKLRQSKEALPPDAELRSEYDRLYQDFISSNSGVVERFIQSKSKTYLKAFCRANNLPVDITKVSKARVVDVVLQWMAQRKAITQKAT
ncbi:MAG TPA: hypothetical protein VNM72_14805 [Blastocatellia bacterium]|nr:hypothetical protein [Blastocatellia bacterium]